MKALANPIHEVTLPPEDNARERRVSDAELNALRSAATGSPHLADFITLAVETAMRRAELVNAEWRNVNLDAAVLNIPQPIGGTAKTKNGLGRDVPLSPAAVATLRAMRAAMAAVGSSPDGQHLIPLHERSTGHYAAPGGSTKMPAPMPAWPRTTPSW